MARTKITIDTAQLGLSLSNLTEYNFALEEGAFVEVGNNFAPSPQRDSVYSFTTDAGPEITSFSVLGSLYTKDIGFETTFDRDVSSTGVGSIDLYRASDNSLIHSYLTSDSEVVINENVVIIDAVDYVVDRTDYYLVFNQSLKDVDSLVTDNTTTIALPSGEYYLEITPPAAIAFSAIACSDTKVIVGCPTVTVNGYQNAGAAYVYDIVDGTLLYSLQSPYPEANSRFGWEVQINNSDVAVLEEGPVAQSTFVQSVYQFDANTGVFKDQFKPPTGSKTDDYGHGLHLSGTYLLVSDEKSDDSRRVIGYDAGATSIDIVLNDPDVYNNTSPSTRAFGGTILHDEDSGKIVVSDVKGRTGGVTDIGVVYTFDDATGAHLQTIEHPNLKRGFFGESLAVQGDNLYVTATLTSGDSTPSRGIYRFSLSTGNLIFFKQTNYAVSSITTFQHSGTNYLAVDGDNDDVEILNEDLTLHTTINRFNASDNYFGQQLVTSDFSKTTDYMVITKDQLVTTDSIYLIRPSYYI